MSLIHTMKQQVRELECKLSDVEEKLKKLQGIESQCTILRDRAEDYDRIAEQMRRLRKFMMQYFEGEVSLAETKNMSMIDLAMAVLLEMKMNMNRGKQ